MNSYPANDQQGSPGELNALFEEESPPTFLPTYNVYFAEIRSPTRDDRLSGALRAVFSQEGSEGY